MERNIVVIITGTIHFKTHYIREDEARVFGGCAMLTGQVKGWQHFSWFWWPQTPKSSQPITPRKSHLASVFSFLDRPRDWAPH